MPGPCRARVPEASRRPCHASWCRRKTVRICNRPLCPVDSGEDTWYHADWSAPWGRVPSGNARRSGEGTPALDFAAAILLPARLPSYLDSGARPYSRKRFPGVGSACQAFSGSPQRRQRQKRNRRCDPPPRFGGVSTSGAGTCLSEASSRIVRRKDECRPSGSDASAPGHSGSPRPCSRPRNPKGPPDRDRACRHHWP